MFGAENRGRTDTMFPSRDFKSLASAYSAIPAYVILCFSSQPSARRSLRRRWDEYGSSVCLFRHSGLCLFVLIIENFSTKPQKCKAQQKRFSRFFEHKKEFARNSFFSTNFSNLQSAFAASLSFAMVDMSIFFISIHFSSIILSE